MDRFGDWVRDWLNGRGVPDWAVEAAVARSASLGKAKRDHVAECAGLAEGLSINLRKDELDPFKALAPSIQLDSERLAEGMRSDIEELRERLFGSTEAPFKELRQSVDWIERTQEEYQARANCDDYVAYAIPGSPWVHRAPAFAGSPLESLEKVSKQLAKDTGLHQAAIVAYALVGIAPVLPRARIAVHRSFGGRFAHTWATIDIFSGELSFVQLRNLYNRIRERMGTTRKKALSNRDVQLLELVRQVGEPPKKQPGNRGAIRSYWQRFEKKWNRTHRNSKLTGRAAQNRYARLQIKLNQTPRLGFPQEPSGGP